ncbi:hypothetical protein A3D76_04710 [Candidatus Roizmanbacteria bacterium RIFCSPHIGHO2_02_FULL_37_9b]|nr:MAG: hypothetical protein A3D76_04710 [Candidatus Roizmanbacteria bacterium RIFCSPHIGHO2_02_FULL_37_9b]
MEKSKVSDRDAELIYMRIMRIRSMLDDLYPRDVLNGVKESPRIVLFQGSFRNNYSTFQRKARIFPKAFSSKRRSNILGTALEQAQDNDYAAFSHELNEIFIDTDKIHTNAQLTHVLIEEATHSLVKLNKPFVKINRMLIRNIIFPDSNLGFRSSEINFLLNKDELGVNLDDFFPFFSGIFLLGNSFISIVPSLSELIEEVRLSVRKNPDELSRRKFQTVIEHLPYYASISLIKHFQNNLDSLFRVVPFFTKNTGFQLWKFVCKPILLGEDITSVIQNNPRVFK